MNIKEGVDQVVSDKDKVRQLKEGIDKIEHVIATALLRPYTDLRIEDRKARTMSLKQLGAVPHGCVAVKYTEDYEIGPDPSGGYYEIDEAERLHKEAMDKWRLATREVLEKLKELFDEPTPENSSGFTKARIDLDRLTKEDEEDKG